MDKTSKLLCVQDKIHQIVSFLTPYLPLINAHNSDFITCQHWDSLVPKLLVNELLSIDDNGLCLFPSGMLFISNQTAVQCPCSGTVCSGHKRADIYSEHNSAANDESFSPDEERRKVNSTVHNDETSITASVALPNDCTEKFDQLSVIEQNSSPVWSFTSLEEFVTSAASHTLPKLGVLTSIADLKTVLNLQPDQERILVRSFMKTKKSYEVDIMTDLCADLAERYSINNVFDVGTGRGYLGCHLALMHKLRVLGIDSSLSNTSSAANRTRLLQKQWRGLTKKSSSTGSAAGSDERSVRGAKMATSCDSLYRPITMYVSSDTNLDDVFDGEWPSVGVGSGRRRRLMLTGLHTCGDLSANILRLFAATPTAAVVCQVGCCYNLLSERYVPSSYAVSSDDSCSAEPGFPMCQLLSDSGFQLGRNARMLASQSPERSASTLELPPQSIYWRSLLQVVLRDLFGYVKDDWRVGKTATKCKSFEEYAQRALKRIGVINEITDEQLVNYRLKYADQARKNMAFFQLKTVFAPCIETLVLLDRLAFLLEQNNVVDAHIVPVFDPIVSPRRYAIVGVKCELAS